MPMQLADAARGETHVYSGHGLRDGQFTLRDFARPAAFLHPLVRQGEGIFERLHTPRVGCRRTIRIRIGRVERGIGGAWIARTAIALLLVGGLFLCAQLFPGEHTRCSQGRRAHSQEAPARQCILLYLIAHFRHLYDLTSTPSTNLKITSYAAV